MQTTLPPPDGDEKAGASTASTAIETDDRVVSPPRSEKPTRSKQKKKSKDKDKDGDKDGNDGQPSFKPVPFFSLFRFTTAFETTLMILGLILAAAAGATQPVMTIIFGKLTTLFTNFGIVQRYIAEQGLTPELAAQLAEARTDLRKEAGNCALYLMAIGIGTFLTTYAYMLAWNYTSEVQSKRLREQYLAAVMRQEVSRTVGNGG
jgi:ATP-binding cassette subfamily B (MDR/TAP) protein 1